MDSLEQLQHYSRRAFFTSAASGIGVAALAAMWQEAMADEGISDRANRSESQPQFANPLVPKPPHFAPKAKHCIFINLFGGPSQVDLFDPKPRLNRLHGEPLPKSLTDKVRFAFLEKATATLMGSPRKFRRCGESGLEFSDLLPHLSNCADDIAMIRSMHTEAFNHTPGELQMTTGSSVPGRPSIGSWMTYGLGSPARNLPGFVVLTAGGRPPAGGASLWANGFLPPSYQGVFFRNQGEPILNLKSPRGISSAVQRSQIDAVRDLNTQRYRRLQDPQIAARIASYELAFRMQSSAPDLIDISQETAATLDEYGVERRETAEELKHSRRCGTAGVKRAFSTNCLLARRLVERGVRFVNLFHGTWDQHDKLDPELAYNCSIVDQPIAALIKDLKRRGLLDSTLVVWASEFGRTPLGENRNTFESTTGRDHHPFAFTLWMAGGGVRGGQAIGKTDDVGWNIEERPVHVNDFHATILHLMGLDHLRLTYRYQGRDFRLTDVGGHPVKEIFS